MSFWITTDTHFGHVKMAEKFKSRPVGFDDTIVANLRKVIEYDDVLIHLGDVSFDPKCKSLHDFWYLPCKKWLVLGNHDKKTVHSYLDDGWDFVAHSFNMNYYGMNILFSHMPQKDNGFELNIHGHFHDTDYRKHEPHMEGILTYKHYLLALEHNNYQPWLLETVLKKFRKIRYKHLLEEHRRNDE